MEWFSYEKSISYGENQGDFFLRLKIIVRYPLVMFNFLTQYKYYKKMIKNFAKRWK